MGRPALACAELPGGDDAAAGGGGSLGPHPRHGRATGRAIIEQVTDAIVAVTGAGPSGAWRVLRETSQRINVELRALAVA